MPEPMWGWHDDEPCAGWNCWCAQPDPATSARWVTTPGDEQHRAGADCPCRPVVHPGGAVDHR